MTTVEQFIDNLPMIAIIIAIFLIVSTGLKACVENNERSDERRVQFDQACFDHCLPGTAITTREYAGLCTCTASIQTITKGQ